jgi:lipopolysaccharide export system ATP-binding protein
MKPTPHTKSRGSGRPEKGRPVSEKATAAALAGGSHANGHAEAHGESRGGQHHGQDKGLNGGGRPASGYKYAQEEHPQGEYAGAQPVEVASSEQARSEIGEHDQRPRADLPRDEPPGSQPSGDERDSPPGHDPAGDAARANGYAPDGHELIHVNGITVDPRTIQGLVGYHLGKQYRGRPVVRDVSVGVQRGEVVGLLGPNGAGKTTCFYIITGLIRSDSGAIYLDGEEVTDLPMYQRARGGIGYLPQEASIFRGMSGEDNIMTVLEIAEPDRAKRKPMMDQLLEEFAVSHLRRTPAMALSGGERRRVEIARCLASRPNYILLDEPLAGIDPIAVGDIRDIVSHLKDRGIGVLITDHNVRDTLEIVDRAYILHEGHVLREGTPHEIVGDPQVRRVYLGERFSL